MIELRHYINPNGKDVFESWVDALKDDQAEARIAARINRLSRGNFGDCKPVGRGVWELRVDYGPGYRVYYAVVGQACVLLLCGGDKRKQSSDIASAIEYLRDYKERSKTQ